MKPTKSSSMCVNALGTSLVWFCNHNNENKKKQKCLRKHDMCKKLILWTNFIWSVKMNYDSKILATCYWIFGCKVIFHIKILGKVISM